jgi:signal peptidase I
VLNLLAHYPQNQGIWAVVDKLARTPLSQVLMFVAVCTALRVLVHPYLTKVPPAERVGSYPFARFLNEVLDAIVYAGVFVFMVIRPFGIQAFQIPSESMEKTLLSGDFIVANKAVYRYSEPEQGDIIVFRPPERAKNADQGEVDFIKRLIGKPGDVIEVDDGVVLQNGQQLSEPYKNKPPDMDAESAIYDWKLVHYQGSYGPWRDKYIPVTITDGPYGRFANHGTNTSWEYAIGTFPEKGENSVAAYRSFDELSTEELQRMQELLEAPPAAIPPGHFLMMGDNRTNSYDSRGWGLVPRENLVGRAEFIWAPVSRWGKTR